MSFGQQFLSGQQFAQGLIGTYRDAQQRRELEDIANSKPVQSDELTAEDSAKVQQAAADPTQHIGYDTGIMCFHIDSLLTVITL